jgi:hypothetical protein
VIDADLLELYRRLAGTDLPLMVVGAVAASRYGEPRSTLDLDVVVAAEVEHAERIAAAFSDDRFYVPPIEVVRRELARRSRGSFNVIDSATGLKADIYPAGGDDLIAYGLDHRQQVDLGGERVWLAPATYVIAMKLRYFALSGQEKHLRDIRAMLAVSGGDVDRAYVEVQARSSVALDAWRRCCGRVGEE